MKKGIFEKFKNLIFFEIVDIAKIELTSLESVFSVN